jgi:hypothetical protein
MLNEEAIKKILGIEEEVALTPEDMAKKIIITFYPVDKNYVSGNVLNFAERLINTLKALGIKIIPYEKSLEKQPLKRRLKIFFYSLIGSIPKGIKKGRKIKEGVTVIALGEGITGDLAMDNTMGFAKNSVVSILDMPAGINNDTEFHKHFDTAMNLFAYHMTNIAIVVNDKIWIPYNFNASHPVYSLEGNFIQDILKGLIPKIAAPIRPPRLKQFVILKNKFDPFDDSHKFLVEDFLESGAVLEKTGLYPPGKLLDELPFRNDFYRWIGKIHLDQRNGMSYGFLARQMPVKLGEVFDISEVAAVSKLNGLFLHKGKKCIELSVLGKKLAVEVPEVWVLTQRSGSKKTDFNPYKDVLKMGLKDGIMYMQIPSALEMTPNYKPSFDTKVILAHAVGNAIIGSIQNYFDNNSTFAKAISSRGMAIAHWHGYVNPDAVPKGWVVYGKNNVPVSCSTHQAAIFALSGKINAFIKYVNDGNEYLGDIHIEPHHGTNMNYFTLKTLAEFLSHRDDVSKLGNHYLNYYHNHKV